jgi:small subunit ribosomal protein S6
VTEDHTNVYEGLFLFPQTQAAHLQAAVDHLKDILARAEAELISLRKWDERRLAFEIRGNKRGVYFLVYFRARGSALRGIERSCNLSEQLLRSMITRADHLTQEKIEAADGTAQLADEIKLQAAETAPAADKAAGEGPKNEQGEAKEPVTVETEPTSKDAATTAER